MCQSNLRCRLYSQCYFNFIDFAVELLVFVGLRKFSLVLECNFVCTFKLLLLIVSLCGWVFRRDRGREKE